MTLPVDIQETVTRELSTFMEALIDNYESQGHGPATLRSVREAMAGGMFERLAEEGRVRLEDKPNLLLEVEALVESSGDDALAVRFTRPRASEDLSTPRIFYASDNPGSRPRLRQVSMLVPNTCFRRCAS